MSEEIQVTVSTMEGEASSTEGMEWIRKASEGKGNFVWPQSRLGLDHRKSWALSLRNGALCHRPYGATREAGHYHKDKAMIKLNGTDENALWKCTRELLYAYQVLDPAKGLETSVILEHAHYSSYTSFCMKFT